jgi:hypothetical protein
MKKISQLLPGEAIKLDRLLILCVTLESYIYLMEGHPIKRTDQIAIDLELPYASMEEIEETLLKVNHEKDWYSILQADFITNKFLKKELTPNF